MEQQLLLSNPKVHSKSTKEVSLLVVLVQVILTMQSLLLVMEEREAQSSGPTDRPLTTKKPCLDKFSNCAELATRACWQDKIKNSCAKSCGLCPGMRPARSNYYYDKFSNCASMKDHCSQDNIKQGCKISCRQC